MSDKITMEVLEYMDQVIHIFLGALIQTKSEESVYVSETCEMESLFDFHMKSSKALWNKTY